MAWMIVSDSSCEIRELKNPAPGVQFALVPFKIRVGEREYVDLATLNTQQMLQAMTDYNGASTTACPSPEEWAEYFLQADNVFALTISSNLSEFRELNFYYLLLVYCAGLVFFRRSPLEPEDVSGDPSPEA